jgi:hypothetical protein
MKRIRMVINILIGSILVLLIWIFFGKNICSIIDTFYLDKEQERVNSIELNNFELIFNKRNAIQFNNKLFWNFDNDSTIVLRFNDKYFELSRNYLSSGSDQWISYKIAPNFIDTLLITESSSLFFWKEPFRSNFISGQTPDRYRFRYVELSWINQYGRVLNIKWKYKQIYYRGTGWSNSVYSAYDDNSYEQPIIQIIDFNNKEKLN